MANKALEWDVAGQHLFETGVDHVVIYTANDSQSSSHKGYGEGVAWSGISSIQESPEGADPNAIYADNIKYLNLIGAEELNGTIEAYMYPDAFAECNGEKAPLSSSTPVGMVLGQQNRKTFGLCYRTILGNDTKSNDYAYKLHFLYGCTVSPSDNEYSTVNDSPEAKTMSWEFSTVPTSEVPTLAQSGVDFKPTASVVVDSSKFFNTDTSATTKYTANFQALLDFIYGKADSSSSSADGNPPYLPTPKEIFEILTTGSVGT